MSLADPIDIVTDPIPPHEYKVEEDTRLYKSDKTQRGPLQDDWIEEYNNNPGKTPIMCAYKLCKVEFRYWGMQSKIERFIHDVGEYAVRDGTVFQCSSLSTNTVYSHLNVETLWFLEMCAVFSIVSP